MVGFQQAFGKSYMAPPGVPAEQVKILRDAFNAVLKDKELAGRRREAAHRDRAANAARTCSAWSSAPTRRRPNVVGRLKKIVEP